MIIIKTSVESSDQVGAMFGLQQTCSSIARGIAPTFVSALFAFSIDHQVLRGSFVWLVLTLISFIAIPLSARVRDVPAPGRDAEPLPGAKTASKLAIRADDVQSLRSQ